jgi:hypothetical protein
MLRPKAPHQPTAPGACFSRDPSAIRSQVASSYTQQIIHVTMDLLAMPSRHMEVEQATRGLYACGVLKRKCRSVCSRFPGRQLLRLHMQRGFGVTKDTVMIGGIDNWAQRAQKGENSHLSDENRQQQLCSAKQNWVQTERHARGLQMATSSRLRGLKCNERCMSAKRPFDTSVERA